jgi:hypothetical protein
MPQREVVKADPALRRIVFLCLLLVVSVGLFAVDRLPRELATILALARAYPEEARRRTVVVLGVILVPLVALVVAAAVDAIRRGVETVRAECYPPPGMRVFRDTVVVRGRLARVLGMLSGTLGALLILLCVTLAVFTVQLGVALQRGCPKAGPVEPAR